MESGALAVVDIVVVGASGSLNEVDVALTDVTNREVWVRKVN